MQRIHNDLVLALLIAVAATACGGDGKKDPGGDPPLACRTGNCGQESFLRAVPRNAKVRIDGPRNAARSRGPVSTLEAVSPDLLFVEEHVTEINEVVDAIFADIEYVAGDTPEIATDTEHEWRAADPEIPGHEEVLNITTTDEVTFTIEYHVGPAGFDADLSEPILSGTVHVADETQDDFDFTIDLDALADLPGFDTAGDILVAVMPLAGGDHELWYDFHDVDLGDGDVETSRTTYWDWDGDESGGLEFLADFDDHLVTVYARWDAGAGRYDHHAAYVDADLGQVDEIATNCWAAGGAETFDAWAVIDVNGDYYGEIDGVEDSCAFGPVEDHPTPGEDFDDLPDDGEWDDLVLNSL